MQIATADDVAALRADMAEVKAMLARLSPAPEWLPIDQFAADRGVTVRTVNEWAKSSHHPVQAKGRGKMRMVKVS